MCKPLIINSSEPGGGHLAGLYEAEAAEAPAGNASVESLLTADGNAILAALSINGVPAFAYAPTVAKRAAVGRGSATKEQIAVMISAELGIEIEQIPLDSTDALALAMCHAARTLRSGGVPGRQL